MSGGRTLPRMKLPAIKRANLVVSLVAGYLVFCLLYLGSATTAVRAPRILESSSIDLAVPFVAGSIWVYLSQFVLLLWALVSARDDAVRSRGFYAMLLATSISAIIFVLFPTNVPRPAVPTEGLLGLAWQALHLTDTPNNAFPSLHVALAALAGILLWQRQQFLLAVAWPACIAVSTLTTRQHVSGDIAGGLFIATLAWLLVPMLVTYDRKLLASCSKGR